MKVFISSMRRGLEHERDRLSALLTAVGHEVLRFEDFTAQPTPSREACIAGVQAAEVYVLILGDAYGEPFADSGVSATEEEFNTARNRNVPILVFKKDGGTPEQQQSEFIARVGNYADGSFWKSFTNTDELGVAVVAALREVQLPAPALALQPLSAPVSPPWRTEQNLPDGPQYGAVLEAHLCVVSTASLRPAASLPALANQIAVETRAGGMFGQGDQLDIAADSTTAWVVRPTGHDRGSHGGINSTVNERYAGIYAHRDGTISAFQALPRDTFGSVVSQEDLAQRLAVLLRHLAPYCTGGTVTTAAALDPSNVTVGDDTQVGRRNRATMHMNEQPIRTTPGDQFDATQLRTHANEIAADLAYNLINLLTNRRW